MAHGFLSYEDSRGESGIEKALEDYLEKKFKQLRNHVTKKLRNTEQKTEQKIDQVSVKVEEAAQLPAGQTPLLTGNDQRQVASTPLQKMLSGTALQRSLPAGAGAVNPEVVGGGLARAGFNGRPLRSEGFVSDRIVDIGSTDLGYERDIGGDDMFVKRIESASVGESGEVVQAIDRLTMVTMSLVAATQQQTQAQQLIAQQQQQEADKLGRKSIAASEEFALEQGGDLSSNVAYQALASQGMGMMGRGGGMGGGGMMALGAGIGGKAAASRLGRSVMKRGGARAAKRFGIALGGRFGKGLGKTLGRKLGGKAIGKIAGTGLAKSLGKKIPLLGLGLGSVFAAQRALQGDFVGAGMELASGAASTFPGIGTGASIGIDAALMAKDMTGMADGGFLTEPTNVIAGEAGAEGFFPLEGARGKKTFRMFGEGMLDAQKKNKTLFGRLQAAGLSQYYDRDGGWDGFFKGLKEILGAIKLPVVGKLFDFDKDKNNNNNNNNNNSNKTSVSGEKGDPKITLGSAEEARIAAALVTEGAGGTASTDILQVLANRMAHGGYGDSYTDMLTRPGQFAGVFDRFGKGNEEKAFEALRNINSIADAAKFAGVSEKVIRQRIADMRNKELRQNSAEHVGGALEFRAQPGFYKEKGLVAGEMGADGRFYGSAWRGGTGDNQYLTSKGKDPMIDSAAQVLYEGLTPETETETETETKTPPKDLSKEGSRGIMRNFGAKTGQRIYFMHDGVLHNAFKLRGTGFDLYKGGMRVETKDGENDDVVDSFLKHVTKGDEDLQSSIQSGSNTNADQINQGSEEVLNASAAGTTIINNYNTVTGGGGGNNSTGDDVFLASNFSDVGPNAMFIPMGLRMGLV